jgi:hypothetical protein
MAKQQDNLPFDERLFTSKQTQQILAVGKTSFFKILPELEAFLDGNRLKITGRSILAYQERRLAAGRVRRSMPQMRKTKAQIEPRAE